MPDGPTGLTVRLSFKTPYFPLFRQLNVTEAAIIPKHVYEPCSAAAMGPAATLGNATGEVLAAPTIAAKPADAALREPVLQRRGRTQGDLRRCRPPGDVEEDRL